MRVEEQSAFMPANAALPRLLETDFGEKRMSHDLPFIDPTRGGAKVKLERAPRPMDLAGKVVGMVDNNKEQGDIILATFGEALRERFGVADVIIRRKPYFSKPATAELIDELAARVDVAIAAVGG
jgi:hypothetical protein